MLFGISGFIIIMGLAVIAGWIMNIPFLKTVFPGYVSMKMNTAICFVLSGTAFFLLLRKNNNIIYKSIAAFLIVFGIASFSQDVFHYNLGIDQFFISDYDGIHSGVIHPGRPSLITMFSFNLLGIVFLIIKSRNIALKKTALNILFFITILSFVAVLGYLFEVPSFYKHSFFSSMAVHTAMTFFILSIAVSFVHKNIGLSELFLSKKTGSIMARKIFPRIILVIIILGYFRMILHRYKIIPEEFAIAIFTMSFILLITYFIFSTAQMLNQIDIKRKEAERKLIFAHKNLEKTVTARTEYLLKQNKKLESFTHMVSHNLRSHVSNLTSLLYFYKEEESKDEKDFLIDQLEKTVNNLGTTLNDLLEIIRIKEDAKKENERLLFEDTFSKTKEIFERKIAETKAEIITDFSKAPEIEYSPVYLESIMQNLLSNALKYSSPERTPVIRFTTSIVNDSIQLEISDNGLGIDLIKYGSQLFGLNKVFHSHPESKGVGLFITKAQIEGMGGEIQVHSEVNKGTEFKIVFNKKQQSILA
jgi:signal transduction histidine kinase